MPVVWELPGGSVCVYTFMEDFLARERRPGETTDEAVLRLADGARDKMLPTNPALAGRPAQLVKTADVPRGKAGREQWRLRDGKVVVDPAVPPRAHPKQALLDAIDGARDVGELKALLRQVVTG